MDLIVRILVNGAALIVASIIVPNFDLPLNTKAETLIKVGAVALIFALINTYLRPIVKMVSLPITLITMGLVGLVINAAMLLLLAAISHSLGLGLQIGAFPPTLNADAFVTAFLAGILISIVATVLSMALGTRKVLGIPL